MYPYTDFEQPLYLRDNTTAYYIPNPVNQSSPNPEIWHAIMPFGQELDAYKVFFDKLETYHTNPSNFVSDRLWYDNFITLKDSFLTQDIPYYTAPFVFAEDINYHRFTPLLLELMQQNHNDIVQDTLS